MTDPPDTYEKFSEYRRTGDRALRNELVEEHMRLAEFLARRFAHRGEAADDLRQVALVGLLKAVERFEPDRGLQFSSFATPTITGELKRHFRDRGWAVRVPRRVQELHLELDRTVNDLSQELGRPPTPAEIAQRAGVLEEDVLESMEAGQPLPPGVDRRRPSRRRVGRRARRSASGSSTPSCWRSTTGWRWARCSSVLPEREQNIVYLRFFEGLTQSEIAEQVGISQMHVSRLLARSLETLGEHASAGGGGLTWMQDEDVRVAMVTPFAVEVERRPDASRSSSSAARSTSRRHRSCATSSTTLVARGATAHHDRVRATCRSSTRRASACSSAPTSACGKEASGTIRIVGAQPSVRKVFEITGLESALLTD